MYQIFHCQALYCMVTGGMLGGSRDVALPMTYHTEALARKLAGLMHEREYESGGDDHYAVVPIGYTPSRWRWEQVKRWNAANADRIDEEFPF